MVADLATHIDDLISRIHHLTPEDLVVLENLTKRLADRTYKEISLRMHTPRTSSKKRRFDKHGSEVPY